MRARVSFRNSSRMTYSSIPSWATVDPKAMGSSPDIYAVSNCIDGNWVQAKSTMTIPDPMNKDAHPIFTCPDTTVDEIQPFLDSLRKVPKSGVHNPLKNPQRYVEYGEIARRVSCYCIVVDGEKLMERVEVLCSYISTENWIIFLLF